MTSITPSPEMVERQAAFLVSLTKLGIPPDVQELLVHGSLKLGIAPNALAHALTAALSCPDGLRLVPVEPTARMLSEGESAAKVGIGKCNDADALPRVWRAMLAASPSPAQEPT